MSFFKDFKEDFAQAMNELMPESNEMYDEDEGVEEAALKAPKKDYATDERNLTAKKEKRGKEEKKISSGASTRSKKLPPLKKKGTEEKNDFDIAPEDLSDQIDALLDSELYGNEEQVQMSIEDRMESDAMDSTRSNSAMTEKDMGLEALLDSIAMTNHTNGSKQEVYQADIVSEERKAMSFSEKEDAEALETVEDVKEKVEFVAKAEDADKLETNIDMKANEQAELLNDVENVEEKDDGAKLKNLDETAKLEELIQDIAKRENTVSEENTMSGEKDVNSINSAKAENTEEEKDFNVDEADTETTYITKGTKITGDLESDGSVDVIGNIEGNITCKGKVVVGGNVNGNITSGELYANNAKIAGAIKSYGSVKIGVGSVIVGNVEGESAVIAGAVNGDIDVQGPVIVDSTAVIMGNIKSRSVQINNGAVIEGFCSQSYSDIDVKSFFE